ncbi:MAG: Hsp70 family protein, partial [Planctomycetaceae bacterium]|nr:Hsp70 family protein [Planctomycetaceae bacterium]
MAATVGIDLGTTNSLVAVLTPEGPRLIPNALGHILTPSVVALDDEDHVLVGSVAKELQVVRPQRCASLFKRHMGSDWGTQIGKQTFSAIDLSAWVLRSLKADAEAFLGESVTQAVVTVPAYFNEDQRRATMAAGRQAGLQVDRILNEPTAAAIAYGLHDRDSEKIAVVIDLGGGTFDVSIVDIFEGTLEIRASAGEVFLGGEDFTTAMVSHVLTSQGMVFERCEMDEPLRVSRLRRECELAKRQLARQDVASVRMPDAQGQLIDDSPLVEVRVDDFEKWTTSILD